MTKFVLFVVFILVSFGETIAQNISKDSITIRTFVPRDYRATSLNYSAIEDENGIIYVANENGILEYDGSEWNLIPIRNYSSAITLAKGPDGRIYVGGVDEFGYIEHNNLGEFQYFSLRNLIDPSLKLTDVWQILFFGNQVYFQTYESIIRYNGEAMHPFPLVDSYLFELNNKVFVSTYNKGIGQLSGDSVAYMDNVLRFKDDAAFKTLLGPSGKCLVLTEFNGIFLLDTADFSYEKWNVEANKMMIEHGLYDGIMWDDSTYLFSTTNHGIAWANMEGEAIRTIDKEDGLSTNYSREVFRDSHGGLWLPSEGINYLKWPDTHDPEGLKTLIRYVEVNDSIVHVNASKGELQTDKGTNSLVFHFATPGYDKSDLEYSYFLEGFESGWSVWKNDVKKEYTNLEQRAYIFHVKARLAEGKVSSQATIDFTIPALWYQNFWVYFFGILVLAVIIWAGILLRLARLKSINEKLEKIISNRTRELVNQKEQLHTANEELTVANTELDNFVYRSSHDLIAPLKSLKGLIGIAQGERHESERERYLDMMNRSVVKLEEFIKSILEYSSNANGEIANQEINLNDMLDNIVEDLKYFERAEKVELKRHFDNDVTFRSDPKRIKIILSNLIANSIKYHNYNQSNPHIVVSSKMSNSHIDIMIEDNGLGIDSKYLNKIFEMFYRASENSQGSGLGLYIVKDTVSKLNGDISAKSELGKGTSFSMRLNLN